MTGRTWWINPEGKRKFQRDSPGPEWVNSYGKRKKGKNL
jgi:hypothetical protein